MIKYIFYYISVYNTISIKDGFQFKHTHRFLTLLLLIHNRKKSLNVFLPVLKAVPPNLRPAPGRPVIMLTPSLVTAVAPVAPAFTMLDGALAMNLVPRVN